MNAEFLLTQFDRLATEPGAVPKLRRLVLDLAVRGKLVEQDPSDEPADKLLERIAAEKKRLVEAGEVKRLKKAQPLDLDDLWTELPNGWAWSQMAEIGLISPRNEADAKAEAGFVPMPLIPAEWGVSHTSKHRTWAEINKQYTHFADGDVALAKITPCFENGKSTILEALPGGLGAGTTELHVVRPMYVERRYLLAFLKCPHFIETGIPRMTGTAGQKRVPSGYFAHYPLPLPPLAEQTRIVARVDALMARLDALEAAQDAREAARERFTAASQDRLSNPDPDPETFKADAGAALGAFTPLTTRPAQVEALRQTILSLAVRGKLVEQDPADGAAEVLREHTLEAKAALKEASADRRIKSAQSPAWETLPFTIPSNWSAESFENLFLFIDYRGKTPPKTSEGVPLITAKNVRMGYLDREPREFVSKQTYDAWMKRGLPRQGDLFFTTEAPLGHVCVNEISEPFALAQRIICFRQYGESNPSFFRYAIMSHEMQSLIDDHATGLTAKGIKAAKLKPLPIPLPPLAEQRRIVEKVDRLMALCDRLEAALTTAETARAALLDAAIRDALEPSEEAMEAAE